MYTSIGTGPAIFWLALFSALFAAAGILYARRWRESLEDFVVARNTQGPIATFATLLASALGAWILFSPPEAATWGGIPAVVGYALGSMSPLVAMLLLGRRMRQLMPHGHTLTEFLLTRYGRPMYALTLAIMVFYVFIELTAEITAISMLMTLLAPVPMGLTATVVMGTVLLYTAVGGLRARRRAGGPGPPHAGGGGGAPPPPPRLTRGATRARCGPAPRRGRGPGGSPATGTPSCRRPTGTCGRRARRPR